MKVSSRMMIVLHFSALMLAGFVLAEHEEGGRHGIVNHEDSGLVETGAHRGLRHDRKKQETCKRFKCPRDWKPIDDDRKECSGKCDKDECCVREKKTCKDDFTCPKGYLNVGDKECSGKCDMRECCEEEKKTCKKDFTCPDGFLNVGDKECSGKCNRNECCEKEKETCKNDFTCPKGYLNLGDKECSGKCDRRECCEEEDEKCSNFWCPKGWTSLDGSCDGKCRKRDCCEKKREKHKMGRRSKWGGDESDDSESDD